jgi:hypothetical protein
VRIGAIDAMRRMIKNGHSAKQPANVVQVVMVGNMY